MTLHVDLRAANATLALSGRSAHELVNTLSAIGHRITEETLETWLADLERQGLAERDDAGRWRLSAQAMAAFGAGLSMIERSHGANA
jgi:hypothetical protein